MDYQRFTPLLSIILKIHSDPAELDQSLLIGVSTRGTLILINILIICGILGSILVLSFLSDHWSRIQIYLVYSKIKQRTETVELGNIFVYK